ncbi:hypothetical protein ACHAXR_008885 [Thalassiosira sp. AJA248-18]
MQGYLGSELFWLDRMGIANVVSLDSLERKYHVSYESLKKDGAFICKTSDGEVIFKRCPTTKFPYVDLDEEGSENAVLLVQTVRKNYEGFTRREVERAILARKLQARSGHPSEATFKREMSRTSKSSLFRDCPITKKDISNANVIFGPSKPCLEGKWVRRKPSRVEPEYLSIPANLITNHRYLTLVADVMFVSGLPFFITLSRSVRFVTVQFVPRRTTSELANALKQTINLYSRAGFTCQTGLMDGEFEKIKEKLLNLIVINTTSKNEHVGEIERKIRHAKNQCRSITADMEFSILPNSIIKALVIHAVMFMNAYPDKQGISQELSPREIVLQWQLCAKKHMRAQFGSFCVAYDDPSPNETNRQVSRSVRFVTVQFVPRRTTSELANALKQTINLYSRAGFTCQTGLMDGEFEKIKEKLLNLIVINTTSKNEHVGEIERKIRHAKNQCRSITADMEFSILPNSIIKALGYPKSYLRER